MNPVSTREESLESSEAMYRTFQKTQLSILELTKLKGSLNSTIQAVLPAQLNFKYLQQQQIQALKTVGSYCKK